MLDGERPRTRVYLVRHGDAGNKAEWDGPDRERPLTEVGWRQAEGLVECLLLYPVSRILSSPARRCEQTVVPLARRRGVRYELVEDLAVDGDVDRALDLLADRSLHHAVLCSHGELIGLVLERLVASGLAVAGAPLWEKGSTWVLDSHRDGAAPGGRYLAPLLAPPSSAASDPDADLGCGLGHGAR